MFKMRVLYQSPDNPEEFEKRYVEGHIPLLEKYANLKWIEFEKTGRTVMGSDYPYAYVFTGTWDDRDGWKADMNSAEAAAATEDAKTFAPKFDVITFEGLITKAPGS